LFITNRAAASTPAAIRNHRIVGTQPPIRRGVYACRGEPDAATHAVAEHQAKEDPRQRRFWFYQILAREKFILQ
jgi:hypothetical protein